MQRDKGKGMGRDVNYPKTIGILDDGEIAPRDKWVVFRKFNFKLTVWNAEHIFL